MTTKTVMITGAGSGFGKGASLALAARGHHVIATTETEEQADALRSRGAAAHGREGRHHQRRRRQGRRLGHRRAHQQRRRRPDRTDGRRAARPGAPPLRGQRVRHARRHAAGVAAAWSPRAAGRVIIVSSIAGVVVGPSFGPYSMTKHALEAMGKAMRAELAPQGIDVTLLNPGPYLTGFNDRMADSMWEWFGDGSLNAPATPLFQMMRELRHQRADGPGRGRRRAWSSSPRPTPPPRTTSCRPRSSPSSASEPRPGQAGGRARTTSTSSASTASWAARCCWICLASSSTATASS